MPGSVGDLAIGHALVLIQIDWPQEASTLTTITERILSRGSFSYSLFQIYIICVDILEELTYLWTDHGGGVSLDISPSSGIVQSNVNLINNKRNNMATFPFDIIININYIKII